MTPIRAPFVFTKACDIIGEDAFRVSSQNPSILFFSISRHCMIRTWMVIFVDVRTEIGRSKNSHFHFWTLQEDHTPHKVTFTYHLKPFSSLLHVWSCRHQLTYFHACRGQICTWYVEKCQLVPVRIPSLFQQNVLKAVGWMQLEHKLKAVPGCTLGALQERSEEHLKHPDRWLLFEQLLNFTCCKACDVVGEDAFGVASVLSSILFLRPAGTADKNLNGFICGCLNWDWKI